jgi:hypothetical protein
MRSFMSRSLAFPSRRAVGRQPLSPSARPNPNGVAAAMSRPGLPPLGIPSSKVSRLPWIATVVISTLLWLVAAGGTAVAANNTWSDTGGGFAWGQNGNWSGSVPTLADDLFFGSSFNSTTIDLDVTGLSNSLTITTGVSFTITPTGTQRLILNSGSLTRLT